MKELIIVDGHALAYRAYFAMIRNPLINSKGMNTSAIYGFVGYILRLINLYRDSKFVITFDSKGDTFRKDMYSEYKSNRKPMPDDLREQMPYLDTFIQYLGLPILKKDGLEADDIIASLAIWGSQNGYAVKIVSKDKDLMQLIDDSIHQLTPENGGKFTEYDREKVKEKMGVYPDRVADLLAMMGDSADNVPGLPGVGPKTAIKILEAAGSVPALIENPDKAGTPKLAAKVRENIDLLKISYDLVILGNEIDFEINEDVITTNPLDFDKIKELFSELEFNAYLKDPIFNQSEDDGKSTGDQELVPTKLIGSIEDLDNLISAIKEVGFCSIDTETTSLNKVEAELVGISIAIDTHLGYYIPLGHLVGENLPLDKTIERLKPILEDETIHKIGQNLKYDWQIFKNYNISLNGISFDTMIAAYLVNPTGRSFSMDNLAKEYLNHETIHIEELIGKGKKQISFANVSVEDATKYAGEDAVIPLRLKEVLEPKLEEQKMLQLFNTMEINLVEVLAKLEYAGITIDTDRLAQLSEEYHKIVDRAQKEIFELAGEEFNLKSTQQLSKILFEKLGLPPGKKTKSGYSTNVEVLIKLAEEYEIAKKILKFREKQKLLSTYIDTLPTKISKKTGRLHASFNQTGVATGRLSSSEPNLQNIPVRTEDGRKIREAFVASKGKLLIAADYSQIELRLLAHFSQDPTLIEAFKNGADIHKETAAKMYKVTFEDVTSDMRRSAKAINFGLMYGMGPFKLSNELGISFAEAKNFIKSYFEEFPNIKKFMEEAKENAREVGYTETLFGRKRYLPELNSSNKMVRENAERVAVNTPVQGSGADIIKLAMISIANKIEKEQLPLTMMVQVHDELIFEADEKDALEMKNIVVEEMENACKLLVPLKVDAKIAKNWSEAH